MSGDRANVLLIHVDQLRWDCLGVFGNGDVLTPNIDSLAGDGVRYSNSYCASPICTPSRYSLLSGVYPHQHRGWDNYSTMAPGIDTFPAIMRDGGYSTRAVGKMHFTPTYLDVGFSGMVLAEQDGPGRWDDDYHRFLMKNGLVDYNDLEDQRSEYRQDAGEEYWKRFGAVRSNLPEEAHSTTWIADRAVEILDGWTDGGNLLMVGFIKPHHPFDPPREWLDKYDPAELTLLPGWTEGCFPHDLEYHGGYFPHESLDESSLRRVMAAYYATISQIDYHVGRMIDLLKGRGLYDETLIVYTSDHGDYMGYHHMLLKGGYMYEPLARVPLIIKYPGAVNGGEVSDALVTTVDVAPTVLAQAGYESGTSMDGLDLGDETSSRDVVFAEGRTGNHVMATDGRYKLIMDHNGGRLFYDLANDPYEMDNIHENESYRAEIAALRDSILRWRGLGTSEGVYLDENAPIIDGDNVPVRNDGHRDVIVAYYEQQMTAVRNRLAR